MCIPGSTGLSSAGIILSRQTGQRTTIKTEIHGTNNTPTATKHFMPSFKNITSPYLLQNVSFIVSSENLKANQDGASRNRSLQLFDNEVIDKCLFSLLLTRLLDEALIMYREISC